MNKRTKSYFSHFLGSLSAYPAVLSTWLTSWQINTNVERMMLKRIVWTFHLQYPGPADYSPIPDEMNDVVCIRLMVNAYVNVPMCSVFNAFVGSGVPDSYSQMTFYRPNQSYEVNGMECKNTLNIVLRIDNTDFINGYTFHTSIIFETLE